MALKGFCFLNAIPAVAWSSLPVKPSGTFPVPRALSWVRPLAAIRSTCASINAEHQVEEIDRSDELLETIREHNIEAVISVVGSRALSILFKLHRKGLEDGLCPEVGGE